MPVSTGSTTGSSAGSKSSSSSGGGSKGSATGPGGMFGGSNTPKGDVGGSKSGTAGKSTGSGSIGSKGGGASTQAAGSGTGGAKAGTVSKSGLAAASGNNAANRAVSTRGITSAKPAAAKSAAPASKSPSTPSKGSGTGPGGMFGGSSTTPSKPSAKVSDPSRGGSGVIGSKGGGASTQRPGAGTSGSGIVGSKGGGASTQRAGAGTGGAKAGTVTKAGLAAAEGNNAAIRQQQMNGITRGKTPAEKAREQYSQYRSPPGLKQSFAQTYGKQTLQGNVLTGTPRNVPVSPAKESPRVAGSATGPGGMFGGSTTPTRSPVNGSATDTAWAGGPSNPQRSAGIKSDFGGINTGNQVTGNKTNLGGRVNGSATDTAWAGGPTTPQTTNTAGKTDKNPSAKVARPSGTDTAWGGDPTVPQTVNESVKVDRAPRMPTNADLAREIGNMYNAAKNTVTNAYNGLATVFTGPAEQTVNRTANGSLPASALSPATNLSRAVAPYSSGDIAMRNAVSGIANPTAFGAGSLVNSGITNALDRSLNPPGIAPTKIADGVAPSVPTRGLPAPTGEESVTPSVPTRVGSIGYGFPSFNPSSPVQQQAVDRGLVGSINAAAGIPAAPTVQPAAGIPPQSYPGADGVTDRDRAGVFGPQSAIDQARQERFAQIAAARGQIPAGASIVPAGGLPPGAPQAINPVAGAPQMVNPLTGVVTFSNLANPDALSGSRLVGRGDLTAPGLAGYGNIGGAPVGTLGNRGMPTPQSPGQSINPSQEGDMVAPSQQYDGPPDENPSQIDGQPQDLRQLYNRYKYEKQKVKDGVRSLPSRIGQAIRDGDFRNPGLGKEASVGGKTDPEANTGGYGAGSGGMSDVNALIAQLLLTLQQQQQQGIANPSQRDLVFKTFV